MSDQPDIVSCSTEVVLAPAEAFELFTAGLATWWPAEFSWSQDVLERVEMEPREGGLFHEFGPHGFRCDWGRVLAWRPPERLVFSWQITPERLPEPNPGKASEVEVCFGPTGAGSLVELDHRGFERHGEGATGYAEMMGSQGWPFALERFAAAAAG